MNDDDALHGFEPVEHLPRPRVPRSPQSRAAKAGWNYPIEGYYLLEACPGRLMIPSIEEYRTCCTTPRFRECRWFRGAVLAALDERKAA
jgi:hypothetical protein